MFQNGSSAKVSSREMFQNGPSTKVSSREMFQNGPSTKVSSREMFQNGSSAKVFSRKLFVYFTYFFEGRGGGHFSSIFSSAVKKLEKILINCIFNNQTKK